MNYLQDMFVLVAFSYVIGLVIFILFLLTLYRTLEQISSSNRKIPLQQIWLCLIPVFGAVWLLYVVIKLSESLTLELESRGITKQTEHPTRTVGIVYVCASLGFFIPIVGSALSFVGLIFWIIYWVTVRRYKKILIKD